MKPAPVTLAAVFVPMAFFGGSTGDLPPVLHHHRGGHGAVGVRGASTLTPALCASILKAPTHGGGAPRIRTGLLGLSDRFFLWFNRQFDAGAARYRAVWRLDAAPRQTHAADLCRHLPGRVVDHHPRADLLPAEEDQGYILASINLPAGATDARLQGVLDEVNAYFKAVPEVISFNQVSGLSGDQSSARAFIRLKPWADRPLKSQTAGAIAHQATQDLGRIRDARIFISPPPAVRSLGSTSGFNFMLKDVNGLGHQALLAAKDRFLQEAHKRPELTGLRSTNLDDATELRLAIDDRKAAALGLQTEAINGVLSSSIGGTYVNDFLHQGRVKRVYIQGDAPHRMLPQDVGKWAVRNKNGEMVPFGAFSRAYWAYGSPQLLRYSGAPAMRWWATPRPA